MEPIEGSTVMKPGDITYSLSPRFGANLYPQVQGLRITLGKGGGSPAYMVTY